MHFKINLDILHLSDLLNPMNNIKTNKYDSTNTILTIEFVHILKIKKGINNNKITKDGIYERFHKIVLSYLNV